MVLTVQINCIMTKSRVLIISIIVLVLLNIGLIAVLMLGHAPRPHHENGPKKPKFIVIEKLHFDENQINKYEVLIDEHRSIIKEKEVEMRAAKHALFDLLKSDNQEGKNERIAKINIIQKDIEEIHFNHFIDIKKLCNPNQIKDYNELTHELAKIFAPHKRPKKR